MGRLFKNRCLVAIAKTKHLLSKTNRLAVVGNHILCKAGRHKYQNLVQSSDNNETKSTRSSPRNADVSDALSNLPIRYKSTFGSNW